MQPSKAQICTSNNVTALWQTLHLRTHFWTCSTWNGCLSIQAAQSIFAKTAANLPTYTKRKRTSRASWEFEKKVSSEAGDWKLRLRNQHGVYEELTLRNVVYMHSASHNILSPRLIKPQVNSSRHAPEQYGGWFPDFQLEHLYHTSTTSKIPFYEAGSKLLLLPTLDCHSAGISANTARTLDKLHPHCPDGEGSLNKASVHAVAATSQPASKPPPTVPIPVSDHEEKPFTYSWFGGIGAFAAASGDCNCASYFDNDSYRSNLFVSRNPSTKIFGGFEDIRNNPAEFVACTKDVDYIHIPPPVTHTPLVAVKEGRE